MALYFPLPKKWCVKFAKPPVASCALSVRDVYGVLYPSWSNPSLFPSFAPPPIPPSLPLRQQARSVAGLSRRSFAAALRRCDGPASLVGGPLGLVRVEASACRAISISTSSVSTPRSGTPVAPGGPLDARGLSLWGRALPGVLSPSSPSRALSTNTGGKGAPGAHAKEEEETRQASGSDAGGGAGGGGGGGAGGSVEGGEEGKDAAASTAPAQPSKVKHFFKVAGIVMRGVLGMKPSEEEVAERPVKSVRLNTTGSAVMVADSAPGRWERLTATLVNTPLIQTILEGARALKESEVGKAAQQVKTKIDDSKEALREKWETSQHP
jgi:hypothetical protein